MRKLTKVQKRDIAAIAAKKDRDLDFSDAPPVLDWRGAEVGKLYRPAKRGSRITVHGTRATGHGTRTRIPTPP